MLWTLLFLIGIGLVCWGFMWLSRNITDEWRERFIRAGKAIEERQREREERKNKEKRKKGGEKAMEEGEEGLK